MSIILWLILIILLLILVVYVLMKDNNELRHNKRSQSVKYGKMSENFMPFMESYPYDYHKFRFLGNPIDGVQFNDDEIVFIEFKIGSSRLSDKQKNIKDIIEDGNVKFKEVRI